MWRAIAVTAVACCLITGQANAQRTSAPSCPPGIDVNGDVPRQPVGNVQSCTTRMSNGFPIPDPACTPGAANPTLTIEMLRNPRFRTPCVRDKATTATEKETTYGLYGIPHPSNNTHANQTCELDHLISLELGGADTLDNIWPQCGPPGVALGDRYFKIKDTVENFLAAEVRAGRITLQDAQRGIATDWTQFIGVADANCPGGRC